MTSVKQGKGVRDLTRGNPYLLLLSFMLPIFLSQTFQQLYNTADALIVGKYLGTASFAAVTSSGPLIFLFTSFFIGAALGSGVVISRYFGEGDAENVSRSVHTTVALALVCGAFMTVAGVVTSPMILRWMNTDPAVIDDAVTYFRVYFCGSLAIIMYNFCRSIMNALGDSRRPLYYLIVSSLLNIFLDWLFIGVMHFGVGSAAFATVISQFVSVFLCLLHLFRPGEVYSLSLRKLRFDKTLLWEMVRYGVPAGVQNSVIGLANVVVQSQINSFGEFATAGYGAYTKIEGFAFLPITSFNMAATTFVSQNLGAKEYERTKQGALFSLIATPVLAEIVGIVVYVWAPQLIAVFDKTPEVIAYGAQEARIAALFYCLLAFSHAVASVLRGAGKSVFPMIVMLAVWCVLRVIYIMLMMRLFGRIVFVYWAYPITWSISSVIYLILYVRSDWIHGFDRMDASTAHPSKT